MVIVINVSIVIIFVPIFVIVLVIVLVLVFVLVIVIISVPDRQQKCHVTGTYLLTYLFTYLLTYLLTYLFIYFVTYLLSHLLTYLLIYFYSCWLACSIVQGVDWYRSGKALLSDGRDESSCQTSVYCQFRRRTLRTGCKFPLPHQKADLTVNRRLTTRLITTVAQQRFPGSVPVNTLYYRACEPARVKINK